MNPLSKRNLFAQIPGDIARRDEFSEILAGSQHARVERIVSRGHASPPDFWYDQNEVEWVLLIAGRAKLRLDGDRVLELGPGDHVLIPAHTRHRVDWTDPSCDTVWLAVFLPT
jgi:cupin 2 domain-containing protein